MGSYSFKEHGFTVIKNFFSPGDLKLIKDQAQLNISLKPKHSPMFSSYSVFEYDVLSDKDNAHGLKRLAHTVDQTVEKPMQLFSSAYIEISGSDERTVKGGLWHLDFVSFSVLEEQDSACFAWFAMENTLSDQEGYLEFILKRDLEKVFNLEIPNQRLLVSSTERFKTRYNADLTSKGKYVLYDLMDMRVVAFSDIDCTQFAVRPSMNPGDLIICDKSVIHRTAPSASPNGMRSACTLRFASVDSTYNGCLSTGIPFAQYASYENSELWQKLRKEKRGYKLFIK